MVKLIWEFLMFHHLFSSPQVKRSPVISNKPDIYELPHELPNDLKNWESSEQFQNLMKLYCSVQPSSQKQHFVILAKDSLKTEIELSP